METKSNTIQLNKDVLHLPQIVLIKELFNVYDINHLALYSVLQLHNNATAELKRALSAKPSDAEIYACPCTYRGIYLRLLMSDVEDSIKSYDLTTCKGIYDLSPLTNRFIKVCNRLKVSFSPYILHALLGITHAKIIPHTSFREPLSAPYPIELNIIQSRALILLERLCDKFGDEDTLYHLIVIASLEQKGYALERLQRTKKHFIDAIDNHC